MEKEKYKSEIIWKLPENRRLPKIGLMIANELHNIYRAIKEKR